LGCVNQKVQLRPAVQIWEQSAQPWIAHLHEVPGSQQQQAFLPAAPPASAA
jgi:hypothetical protein